MSGHLFRPATSMHVPEALLQQRHCAKTSITNPGADIGRGLCTIHAGCPAGAAWRVVGEKAKSLDAPAVTSTGPQELRWKKLGLHRRSVDGLTTAPAPALAVMARKTVRLGGCGLGIIHVRSNSCGRCVSGKGTEGRRSGKARDAAPLRSRLSAGCSVCSCC